MAPMAFFGAKENLKLKVDGMTCQSCVTRVQDTLKGVPGVASAEADLEKGEATVTMKAGMGRDQMLVMALKQVGYESEVVARDL